MAVENSLVASISAERALKFIKHICRTYGERNAGSKAEYQVAKRLASEFKNLGLQDVRLQPFRVMKWECTKCRFEFVSPVDVALAASALPYSKSTPTDGLVADLVYLEKGLKESDYSAENIAGRIVVVDWPPDMISCGITAQHDMALRHGAIAIVGIDGYSKDYLRKMPIVGGPAYQFGPNHPPALSSVIIPHGEGQKLLAFLRKGKAKARLTLETQVDHYATSYNVTGMLRGSVWPEQKIVICAHHDSFFQGANDNASAFANILELGRALRRCELKRSIEIVSFGAEEIGGLYWEAYHWTYGSRNYVSQHRDELTNIVAILNQELAGAGRNLIIRATGPELWELLRSVTKDTGVAKKYKNRICSGLAYNESDHYPFVLEGVPGCEVWFGAPFEQYHTDQDIPEVIDKDKLKACATIVAVAGLRLSNSLFLPFDFLGYAKAIANELANLQKTGTGIDLDKVTTYAERFKGLSGTLMEIEAKLVTIFATCRSISSVARRRIEEYASKANRVFMSLARLLDPVMVKVVGPPAPIPTARPLFLPGLQAIHDLEKLRRSIRSLENGDLKSAMKVISTVLKPSVLHGYQMSLPHVDLEPEFRLMKKGKESFELDRVILSLESKYCALKRQIEEEILKMYVLCEANELLDALNSDGAKIVTSVEAEQSRPISLS